MPAGVRGGERLRLALLNLAFGSPTCDLAITRSYYQTVLVMTERFS
jgi:hypothetical protein